MLRIQAVVFNQLFHRVQGLGRLHPEVGEIPDAVQVLIGLTEAEAGAKIAEQAGMGEIEADDIGREGAAHGGPSHKKGVRRRAEKLYRSLPGGGYLLVLKDKDGAGAFRPCSER